MDARYIFIVTLGSDQFRSHDSGRLDQIWTTSMVTVISINICFVCNFT